MNFDPLPKFFFAPHPGPGAALGAKRFFTKKLTRLNTRGDEPKQHDQSHLGLRSHGKTTLFLVSFPWVLSKFDP
jgi:hypothetical protein